jgi:hypothetical protein
MTALPDKSVTKVAKHRQKMRAAGMRPIQFWVSDTRSQALVAQIRLQCQALSEGAAESDILRFTEASANETTGWQS